MFRQLTMYRLDEAAAWSAPSLAAALDGARFVPCAPTQPLSIGWVAPRGAEHDALLEAVDGQWLLALRFEQRLLPGSVVRDQVQAMAQRVEAETGRRPGKKLLRELKDQAVFELLPQAFTKQSRVTLWIDPKARTLALDTTVSARLDAALSALAAVAPALAPRPLSTALAPATAMAGWLAGGDAPASFTVDADCELKSPDERRALVRYTRHAPDPAELRRHLDQGLRPTQLALTWRDRVTFTLTESLQLKRVALVDTQDERADTGDDAFDADVALHTGELRRLWPDLVEALDGELPLGSASSPVDAASARVAAPVVA